MRSKTGQRDQIPITNDGDRDHWFTQMLELAILAFVHSVRYRGERLMDGRYWGMRLTEGRY